METKRVRFVEPVTHQSPTLRCHEGDQTCYIHSKGESRPEIEEAASSGESSLVAYPAISGKSLSLPLTSLSAKNIVSDENTRVTGTPSWDEKNDEDPHSQTESGRQPFRFLANSVSISVNSRSQEPQKRQVKSQHEKEVMEDSSITRVSKGVSCVSDFEAEQKRVIIETKLKRIAFQFWRIYNTKRRWKKVVQLKDDQICFLMHKLDGAASRPIVYCKRQRLRRIFHHWTVYCVTKRCSRQQGIKAEAFHSRKSLARLFSIWRHVSAESILELTQERRSSFKWQSITLSKSLKAFRQSLQRPQIASYQYEMSACMRRHRLAYLSVCALIYSSKLSRSERHIKCKKDHNRRQSAFSVWRNVTQDSVHWARLNKEASKTYSDRVLAKAFYGWCGLVDGSNFMTLLEQNVFAIHAIEQLYSDNVRLAKIVDGGAWGDHQIELIQSATNVLREEKETLKKILNQFPWSRDRRLLRKTEQRKQISHEKRSSPCPDVFLRLSQPLSSSARRIANDHDEITEEKREIFQYRAVHCPESTKNTLLGQGMGPGSFLESSVPKTVIPLDTMDIISTVRCVKKKFKSMGYISTSNFFKG
ncbi:hypothetical protein M9434_001083 [Picochlorum sp. BPE23]|nr:hypothetical protein M9434_001083 [Picochlorum sp. BPE23]